MTVPVLVWIVDQADIPHGEGFIEHAVLGWGHHPTPEHGSDGLRLLGHPSHDLGGVVTSDQGVVIDKDERLSEPLNGSDLGLERPIRAGWFQWVTAQDEEHGSGPWMTGQCEVREGSGRVGMSEQLRFRFPRSQAQAHRLSSWRTPS